MRIADLHCDTVGRIQAGINIAVENPGGHVDLPRLRAGNVSLQAFAAYIAPTTPAAGAFSSTLGKLDAIADLCRQNPHDFALVEGAESAEEAASNGKVGVLLTVENGHAINENLENLQILRDRGVRMMTLVHSQNLAWVCSCTGAPCAFDGLTEFGEQVVDAMCGMGMIVDVSHADETAFWKVAERMRRHGLPFVASHSNAWELCRYARNLKDDQIREIANQGGVIGINFFPFFLDQKHHSTAVERQKELFAAADRDEGLSQDAHAIDRRFLDLGTRYKTRMADSSITSQTIADHIDHMVNLAGEECVAFGSDFDGILSTPEDATGSDCYPTILDVLAGRGYCEEALEKMAWKNFMRVLRAHE